MICLKWSKHDITMRLGLQRIDCKHVFAYGLSADQVLLNNPLDYRRRTGMIPDAIRIDDRDRPLLTDAEAIRLGPVNAILALREPRFGQALLQMVPGGAALLAGRALRLRLVGAEEDVAL